MDKRSVQLVFARFEKYDHSYRHVLNADERDRADRLRFDRDREFFTFCRAQLRLLLGSYQGVKPADLRFRYGPMGKPYIEEGPVFNASHSGEWFALAITGSGAEIGVDIEHIHPLDDMLSMARHFFAPAEVERLLAIPESERTRAFFECWTRKEAVIKATGEGVSRPLDSFEVAFGSGTTPALLRLDARRDPQWMMASFDRVPDYVAALASPAPWDELTVTFA